MKRVIVFSYDFPPNTGGISRLTENIAEGLSQKLSNEYQIEVLTVKNDNRKLLDSRLLIKNVEPSRFGRKREAYKYLKRIKDKENTWIICGLWWPEGLIAEMAGFKHVSILTHAAEIRPDNTLFRRTIWIPIIARLVLKQAQNVIANSQYTSKLSKSLSPKANVHCLPLAVDHMKFNPENRNRPEDEFIHILTVTRIHLWKGLDTILKALQNLPDKIREKIRWEIAGIGPDLEKLHQMILTSNLSDQVNLLGFVNENELPRLYANADIFILMTRSDEKSSNIEGFGLVFLESQSSGTPAIGTPFGGIPSAIENNYGGWLVKDSKELINLIIELSKNKDLLITQRLNARQRVLRGFTWSSYIDSLTKIINL